MIDGSVSGPPRVSVIIPHYRDLRGLDRCLAALKAQSYPADRREFIVADNASPEGAEVVSETIRGRALLVVQTEKGAGPARNRGVAAASGEVLAFIDSDCVAEPDWLEAGVRSLSGYDLIGGRVRVLVENPERMSAAEAFERVFAFDFKTYIEKKGFTGAGNLFCPRAVFDAVGGFRARVSEDVEWSKRAQAMGFKLGYAPAAIVGHPGRQTWQELTAKWKRVNAETYALLHERKFPRLRWLLRNSLLPASALAHTPKVLLSEELSSWRDRSKALGMLYRLRIWRLFDALSLLAAPRGH